MDKTVGKPDNLADLLTKLVQGSGLTERQVAFRAGILPSALRAWCRGTAIPSTYEQLEQVGLACGATEWDLEDLCGRWHEQAHPPVEMTYKGIRFRGSRHASAWRSPGSDLDSQVLAHAWEALGRLRPVDRQGPETERVLDDLLLDALCSDRALRASARKRLLPARGSRSFDASFGDPESFARRADAMVPAGMESYPSRRRHLLGMGLLHPEDAMAARAAKLIRRDRRAGHGGPHLGDRERQAAQRAVEELAEEWVARWVEWGNACAPSDRELVEDGIRRCYELSGMPWHGRVIWLESPFTGALANRLLRRLHDGDSSELLDRLRGDRRPQLPTERLWGAQEASRDREIFRSRNPDDLRYRMDLELRRLVGDDLLHRTETLVQGRVRAQLALPSSFFEPFDGLDRGNVGPTDPDRVRLDLERAGEQLPRWARARLGRLLAAETGLELWPSSVEYSLLDGHLLAPWLAMATLVQQLCGGRAAGSLWDRLEAYRDANAAGPWWPSGGVVVVAERPQVVRTELLDAPAGPWRRLHAEDGPAVLWGDGTASHAVHGVRLPFDLIRPGWSIGRIVAERNAELRRIAIERLGWDRFVAEAGLALVHGPVPDPGNPGNTLSLYDLPTSYGGPTFTYGADGRPLQPDTRLLLCTNASPDRDGTVRRFGLHVPAWINDAVAAAAWTFDLDLHTYQGLERAT